VPGPVFELREDEQLGGPFFQRVFFWRRIHIYRSKTYMTPAGVVQGRTSNSKSVATKNTKNTKTASRGRRKREPPRVEPVLWAGTAKGRDGDHKRAESS
jgi:hypothetical protein